MSKNKSSIVQRIIRETGIPELGEALVSRLSPSDLQSLLMHVYHDRVSKLNPADVLRQYKDNRFTRAAKISPVDVAKFDSLAFATLPQGFVTVEMSPVAPLGCSSTLGPVHQNNAVTTIRNTEVLSDPTNVMALECAIRKKALSPKAEVKLCSSHRLLRAQVFSGPASFPHFRILSLCSAGRDSGSFGFEVASMVEHVSYYVQLILAAEAEGFRAQNLRVVLIALSDEVRAVIDDKIREELLKLYPDLPIETQKESDSKGTYYHGMQFNLYATNEEGKEFFLVDGGPTDWTQKLLQNRKERLMTSGMGTERFLLCFRE